MEISRTESCNFLSANHHVRFWILEKVKSDIFHLRVEKSFIAISRAECFVGECCNTRKSVSGARFEFLCVTFYIFVNTRIASVPQMHIEKTPWKITVPPRFAKIHSKIRCRRAVLRMNIAWRKWNRRLPPEKASYKNLALKPPIAARESFLQKIGAETADCGEFFTRIETVLRKAMAIKI